jgi:hypothetical protein
MLKMLAIFMAVLVIELSFISHPILAASSSGGGTSAFSQEDLEMGVYRSTGDMHVSIPVMEVPGRGGLDYKVSLGYTSGGGIRMDEESSWVGLGWNLGSGAVTREVVDLPDDRTSANDAINAHDESGWGWFVAYYEDKTLGWVIAVFQIIGMVFSLISGPVGMFWSLFTYGMATGFKGFGVLDAAQVLLRILTSSNSEALSKNYENIYKLYTKAMAIRGDYGIARSTLSIYSFVSALRAGPSDDAFQGCGGDDGSPRCTGYLYNPTYGEDATTDGWKMVLKDGGNPDIWSISGPVSGEMIIGNKNTDKRYNTRSTGILDAKFYLKESPSLDSMNIEFDTDIPYCTGTDYVFGYSPQENKVCKGYPENCVKCNEVNEDIDRFIVTGADGTKYVYGDPRIEGAVSRVYKKQSYYWGDWDPTYKTFSSIGRTPYAYAWKLTAILSPNYLDVVGDRYNPLDDGMNGNSNRGNWVAFRYETTHEWANYLDPVSGGSQPCGFIFGLDKAKQISENDQGKIYYYDVGIKDISYLKKIITPTHEATFYTADKEDGRGASIDGSVSQHFGECSYYSNYPLKKLYRISLASRTPEGNPGSNVMDVYFNKDVPAEQYSLRKNTPGSVVNHGVYTLKNVVACSSTSSDCYPKYEFYYNTPNPDYDENKVDAFGMYCPTCTATQKNGPTQLQSKFINAYDAGGGKTYLASWMLSGVKMPAGGTVKWEYEPDTWFTSRGDAVWYNHYAMLRNNPGIPYSDNYGGGVRVKNMTICDGLQSGVYDKTHCSFDTYSYTQNYEYDGIEYGRSSGSIDAVPSGKTYDIHDADLRKKSHQAGNYMTGSVLYNKVCVFHDIERPADTSKIFTAPSGYECSYFLTSESTPENTNMATNERCDNGYIEKLERTLTSPASFRDSSSMPGNGMVYYWTTRKSDLPFLDSSNLISYGDHFSEQFTDYSWKRGQEYKTEYYSGDLSLGYSGLIKKVEKKFEMNTNLLIFTGGGKLLYNPTGFAMNLGNEGNRLNGLSSGWSRMNYMKTTTYDYFTKGEVSKEVFYKYNPYNGLPRDIIEIGTGKARISSFTYAYSQYPYINSISAQNSVKVIEANRNGYETNNCNGACLNGVCDGHEFCIDLYPIHFYYRSPGDHVYYYYPFTNENDKNSNVLQYSKSDYREVVSHAWYPYLEKDWIDKNRNKIIDSGEVTKKMESMEYDNYGNVLKSCDALGKCTYTRYERGVFPVKGWNDAFGSETEPAWSKKYDSDTNNLVELNDSSGNYEYLYDSLGRPSGTKNFGVTTQRISYLDIDPEYSGMHSVITEKFLDDGVIQKDKAVFDGLGRHIYTVLYRPDGGKTILEHNVYLGATGVKLIEYKPYIKDSSEPKPYTQYDYYNDGFVVVKSVTVSDGVSGGKTGKITYLYGSINGYKTVTVSDEIGNSVRYTYDEFDNLIKTEEGLNYSPAI